MDIRPPVGNFGEEIDLDSVKPYRAISLWKTQRAKRLSDSILVGTTQQKTYCGLILTVEEFIVRKERTWISQASIVT